MNALPKYPRAQVAFIRAVQLCVSSSGSHCTTARNERMSRIRMVHLSDIHFGQENKDGAFHLQNYVRDAVTGDCERMRAKLGVANGIVVTGDIAFAGKKEEYDRAGVWLD